jgi:flagellar hook-associated protein 2
MLFSFQNPFNDRIVNSQDSTIVTGTATREAYEQERNIGIKQVAQADRFLSKPLDESYKVPQGAYTFSVGKDEISFNFRGGSLREFTEALNRRGTDRLQASVITVERGTRSLLVESLVTGAESRLGFSGAAEDLAIDTGIIARLNDSRRDVAIREDTLSIPRDLAEGIEVSVQDEVLTLGAGGRAIINLNPTLRSLPAYTFSFEAATRVYQEEPWVPPEKPPGPDIPDAGAITYGDITIENDQSSAPLPAWAPPERPRRIDDLHTVTLNFVDGSQAALPVIRDSDPFREYQYHLADFAGDKAVSSIEIDNKNTHRDIYIKNIRAFDPGAMGDFKPSNPVSTAQDAELTMDGIAVKRNSNTISDLIPGVTLTLRSPSEQQVRLKIEPDRESIKESLISLVGNYNRLMAELNVLTRNDDKVVQELSYLSEDEQESLRKRLGAFTADSTLGQLRTNLQRSVTGSYPTQVDHDLAMLAQIGISTDVRGAGSSTGYDPARLRGYLEIDEKKLDAALDTRLPAIQQLFGLDTDGDLLVDTGIAYNLDFLTQPYVGTGGIIALKTGTIDSQIDQNTRRVETMDRQLAAKEMALKTQYAQMEAAYNRMDQMSTRLDQFSRQTDTNNNR